jgi:hypothetical protein
MHAAALPIADKNAEQTGGLSGRGCACRRTESRPKAASIKDNRVLLGNRRLSRIDCVIVVKFATKHD